MKHLGGIVLASLVSLAAFGCGKGGAGGGGDGLPFTSTGTVTINGQARTVKKCEAPGQGVKNTVVLTMDDGSVVSMPLHDGPTSVQLADGKKVDTADCERSGMAASGGENNFSGTLARICKGDGVTLDLALELQCGKPGPSNQKPK